MKTGPLERVPPQLSDFHTKVNSKSTWFLFYTLSLLTLYPYALFSLNKFPWGATATQKRSPASCVQEQFMLFIPLSNASDFTLWLPPNSTCLISNSSLWVVFSLILSFFFFFLLALSSFWKLLKRKHYFYPLQYKVCRSITPLGKS